ncbi:chemotaxis protein MotB [Pseudovibrio sp. FO-BEG1]|uniref:Chemotaxis protein MotB n=2 Tax=Pseudovibrio TaxID=258255 RepID=A0A1I7DMI9_9HYPH|nr:MULTISPECIES: flagellar motor protein MotB [Pseudovibrio]AEV39300.1 chemotaxis protein MotB [Pseudovibrio sp. FO-BEG1]EEA93154.1 chemotaxis MotB protein [Pseudovibrio sp. JE062]QUS55311.1 flagellar motor protein MotB [Pseudovibrio brasiliensis]SFU12889.1 chemotaxis protein MotB [Pseudovibrio denitrificans]
MAGRKKQAPAGAPGWMVTFADLMSLLVCFFVLIISFSVQDKQKLQVVAGSIKDAFGIKQVTKRAGVLEIEGVPLRDFMKDITYEKQITDADFATESHPEKRKQGPEANTHTTKKADIEKPRQFATAAVSLRQAFQEMPEITEISNNIILEETDEGLNILIVDQEGRSMYPEGSKYPYEITRRLLAKMAPVLAKLPNRVRITGHTTTGQLITSPSETGWELSADRANTARQILSEYGLPSNNIHSVVGKADTEPLFPNDPYLAANRRISILLMAEEPPLPPDFNPYQ